MNLSIQKTHKWVEKPPEYGVKGPEIPSAYGVQTCTVRPVRYMHPVPHGATSQSTESVVPLLFLEHSCHLLVRVQARHLRTDGILYPQDSVIPSDLKEHEMGCLGQT